MATAFTVGRVGMTLTDVHLSELDHRPGVITVSGTLNESNPTVAEALVEQMLGYVESLDEPYVPVTWGCAPGNTITGFYRVRDVSSRAVTRLTDRGVYEFSVALERVRGFAAPLFEARILGAKRTGVAAGVSAVAWHGIPWDAQGYDNIKDPTMTGTTLYAEGGLMTVATDSTNSTFDTTVSYYLPPASWYVGAATLSVGGYTVVGRQCANLPEHWTISNGLVRLSGGGPPINTGGADMGLTLERWNNPTSAWVSLGNWYPGWSVEAAAINQNPFDAPHAITVLRNSPECVSIRLSYEDGSIYGGGSWVASVDLSLRRGSKVVEVVEQSRTARYFFLRPPWTFDLDGAGTASGTGGLIDTATGQTVALGNTSVIAAANLLQLSTADTRLIAGIGHSISTTYNAAAATTFAARHAAAQVESVRVVAR